jgi:hypothetical protein
MITTIALGVIVSLGISFFLVCLYGFHRAAKKQPQNRMLMLLPGQRAQRLFQPKFDDIKISPARARTASSATVLQFPRRPAWVLRNIS